MSRNAIKIITPPSLGFLQKAGKNLRKNDIIYSDELEAGIIQYQHTTVLNELTYEDFFEFGILFYNGEILTKSDYTECITSEYDIPENGIYRYNITIEGSHTPIISNNIVLNINNNSIYNITTSDVAVSFSEPTELYFTLGENDIIYLNDTITNSFTLTDIRKGKVSVRPVEIKSTKVKITVCSINSKCTTGYLNINVVEPFSFIGANVFYFETLSPVYAQFKTNRENVIFLTQNGIGTPPTGVDLPVADVLGFTEYNEFGLSGAGNGPGYNKKIKYRNYENKYYWKDLPTGISMDSRGILQSSKHDGEFEQGSDLWLTPAVPTDYIIYVTAIDSITDEKITKPFYIKVNFNGFGDDGQIEENI